MPAPLHYAAAAAATPAPLFEAISAFFLRLASASARLAEATPVAG